MGLQSGSIMESSLFHSAAGLFLGWAETPGVELQFLGQIGQRPFDSGKTSEQFLRVRNYLTIESDCKGL